MNIESKNLNLLHVFHVIAQELNLSRSAGRLGLSQPALSHALQRLREDFGDPLFVRVPRGLTPTQRAMDLKPQIEQLLTGVEGIYTHALQEKPSEFSGRITLATTTYFEQIAVPALLGTLRKEAPSLQFITLSLATEEEALPKSKLERGDVDIAVAGFFKEIPEGFFRQKLLEDPFVVLGRKAHPYFRSKQTAQNLTDYSHVMISLRGDLRGRLDEELRKKGLKRHVLAGLGNFITPAWLLPQSDLLLVCPQRLAESYKKFLPLQLAPVPLKLKPVELQMIWHERSHKTPHLKWIREQIRRSTL